MSNDSPQQRGPNTPTRTIEQGYRQCVEARVAFIESAPQADEKTRNALWGRLQRAVLTYFEVMHYQLEEKDAVEKWWAEKPMWKTGVQTALALFCIDEECDYRVWSQEVKGRDGLHHGAFCPTEGCENYLVEKEAQVLNEDGEPTYEWARGLQQLEGWYYRPTSSAQTKAGYLGTRTVEKRSHDRLPVEVLFRAARYLDEAADELELLADVDDAVPETELTKDTIESFAERVNALREQAEEGFDKGAPAKGVNRGN